MKTDDKDRMIYNYMQQNKREVEDIYFSKKVMQKLPPVQRSKEWIIIPFAALGSLLALWLGADPELPAFTLQLPADFNLYYLLGGIAAIPLLVLALYCIREKRIQLL